MKQPARRVYLKPALDCGANGPSFREPSPKADVQTLRGLAEDFQRDGFAGCGAAVAERIAALDSGDPATVGANLETLSQKLRRPCDPALLKRLAGHGNPRVRLWYVQTFATPESEAEIALLIRLGDDPDPEVRSEAIRALAGSATDTPALRDALAETLADRGWESFERRLSAIEGLATRGDPRAMAALEREMETDPLELIGEDERLQSVCAIVSAHPHARYLPQLECWRQRLLGAPDECDEAWIEPVLETIETCAAA